VYSTAILRRSPPAPIEAGPPASVGAELLWHDLDLHGPSHRFPGVRNLLYLRGEQDRGGAIVMRPVAGAEISRAPGRAVHRLDRLLQTLGADVERPPGVAVVCEQAGTADHPSINSYPHLRLGGHECFAAVRLGRQFPAPGGPRPQRVSLIVGHCLFGGGADTEALHQLVAGGPAPAAATLYEVETTRRLAGLTAAVLNTLPAPPALSCTVHLLVPRGQYYLHLLPALERTEASPDHYRRWTQLVDERSRRVRQRLQAELRARLGDNARTVRIRDAVDVLAPVRRHLAEQVRRGRPPHLGDCIRTLRADPAWRLVLDGAHITDWSGLANASYAVSYLTVGAAPSPAASPPLLLVVAEPEETRIHQAAEAAALAGGLAYRPAGLYPLERVIVSDGRRRLRLYHARVAGGRDAAGRHWTVPQIIAAAHGNASPRQAPGEAVLPPPPPPPPLPAAAAAGGGGHPLVPRPPRAAGARMRHDGSATHRPPDRRRSAAAVDPR
jgi:hypothetical protein